MARMTFKAGDAFALQLSRFGQRSDVIAKKAIYEGAAIIADKVEANLEGVLKDSDTGQTGELMASFGVTPIKQDNSGNWTAKIGFDGYDNKGVANQLKARVLESGSSQQKKTPFVRPAVDSTRRAVIKKMNDVINEEIKKLL